MRHAFTGLVLGSMLGCSPPPTPAPAPPPATVSLPEPAPSESPALPVAEAPPPPPAEIREPAEVACRVAGTGWSSEQLRLRPDGPRFASSKGGPASVVLPVTAEPKSAIVVMDDGTVLVRAALALADVHLFSAKPKPLLGIVTPLAETELVWKSSSAAKVRIGLDLDAIATPKPLSVDVECSDLGIVASSYDARASITKRTHLAKREVVSAGAPLAPSPKAAPVATLSPGVEVELIELRGRQAHILADEGNYIVSGWVAQKDLQAQTGLRGAFGRGGLGAGYGAAMGRLFLMHCPKELSLYVELGSERVKVGLIHARAGFRQTADSEQAKSSELRRVDFPESRWLSPEDGARFVVEAAALGECEQDSPGF